MYALYILFKLLLRHLLPVVLVLLCLLRPRCLNQDTPISSNLVCSQDFCSKANLSDLPWRASSLRVWSLWSRTGQTPRVSQDGQVLLDFFSTFQLTYVACSRSRPDILRDTESRLGESMLPPASPPSTAEKTKKSLPVLLEDPVRRRYKAILTVTFIATSGLYIVVDVIFQVFSVTK